MFTKMLLCIFLLVKIVTAVKVSTYNVNNEPWVPSSQASAAKLVQNGAPDTGKTYSYSYGVSDPYTGDHKSHSETRQAGVVSGHYSMLESDGTTRTVRYTADDDNGFKATISKSGKAEEVKHKSLKKPIVVGAIKSTVAVPIVHKSTDMPPKTTVIPVTKFNETVSEAIDLIANDVQVPITHLVPPAADAFHPDSRTFNPRFNYFFRPQVHEVPSFTFRADTVPIPVHVDPASLEDILINNADIIYGDWANIH